MPDGQISHYDPNRGTGRIQTRTGWAVCRDEDMHPRARVEGAFVTFDVVRDDPHDRAVNVVLREGTRNDPNQRRFGHGP